MTKPSTNRQQIRVQKNHKYPIKWNL